MSATTHGPIVSGWFSDTGPMTLYGLACEACETRVFPPRATSCPSPSCRSDILRPIDLARTGTVWSWAVNHYQPPAPYVAPDPFAPTVVVAVELDGDGLTVLGQLEDAKVEELTIGTTVEVVRSHVLTEDGGTRAMYAFQAVREHGSADGDRT